MNTLVFNIAWFFPLLNHQLLLQIPDKAGFDSRISISFSNYLENRKIQYLWNNFAFSVFDINIGIRQESALSPILSALYITPIFHIFEKRIKNLIPEIPVLFLSFVDDSLFISQEHT